MSRAKLQAQIALVDWNRTVSNFSIEDSDANTLLVGMDRFALLCQQIELVEPSQTALSFIREAQVQMHLAMACAALALYKPAATSMRAMVESALYFTYFRSHELEMATLVRDDNYFVDKKTILEFHKAHTPEFGEREQAVDLVNRLSRWYSKTSAIAHGQIPGQWLPLGYSGVTDIAHDSSLVATVADHLAAGVDVASDVFLVALRSLWPRFTVAAKKALVRGIPGKTRTKLRLTLA